MSYLTLIRQGIQGTGPEIRDPRCRKRQRTVTDRQHLRQPLETTDVYRRKDP